MDNVDFKVEVCTIDSVMKHPNADRLSLYLVKGWQVVGSKDQYKVGDKVVYIPVDSVLPPALEAKLFPEDSKIKLHNSRIRAIKIRQFVSQGMLVDLEQMVNLCLFKKYPTVGDDLTAETGIKKYEPPTPKFQQGQSSPASKKKQNKHFQVYTKFPRIQNYPTMFEPEDVVVITEKIHGTNFRAGWVPFEATSLWKKFLELVKLAPKWQFVYGSHYVQLSDKLLYKGYYEQNVYAKMVSKYKLKERLQKGDVIYGEIYGAGIQKGYTYGLKDDIDLVVFDIQRNGEYLGYEEFEENAFYGYSLPLAPRIFEGKYKDCDVSTLCQGPSILAPDQKIREGCVVKPIEEGKLLPRKGAKVINPEYLLGDNTDFH